MFSASLSKPVFSSERPSFLPAASTCLPARAKAWSKRVLRSSDEPRLEAKCHLPEDLERPETLIIGPAERPVNRALRLCTWKGTGVGPWKTLTLQITSELKDFGT